MLDAVDPGARTPPHAGSAEPFVRHLPTPDNTADRPGDTTGTRSPQSRHLLRDNDYLLRMVLHGTTDSIFVKDLNGCYLIINAAGARCLGRHPQDIIGKHDSELFPPETADQILAHDRRVMAGDRTYSYEVVLPIEGKSRVFFSTKTPLRNAEGRIDGLIGISRDITEHREAEKALRVSEERLSRILESAMDAIVTIDDQQIVRLFNAAAEDVFRCRAAEALGKPFDRFASPKLQVVLKHCVQAFGQGNIKKRYVWIPDSLKAVRADGESFPIEATISHVEVSDEKLFTIILRDVNERKNAEQELSRLQIENLYLREEAQTGFAAREMVGESAAIRKVSKAAEQVAAVDSTVLIIGETGTGKELVARAIHACSNRKDRVIVTVNCAALPGGLVESELFGHEKGAFTGALSRKIGRFELANGGTLFLDEVGDMPLDLQAKLLRVLQENEFERVGGVGTIKVDVRVIAATNHDLAQAVREQRFRADLYYRLNVIPIHLPPLRDRREDIPLLARHFALACGSRMGRRIHSIPQATMDALLGYDWPGNVRELQNVIERAVLLNPAGILEPGEWLPVHHGTAPTKTNQDPVRTEAITLEELERRHILTVLDSTRWRVSGEGGAAAILGVRPTTLESRMKRLGISRKR
jgi:formate hydrogenlyase transcriptional activator